MCYNNLVAKSKITITLTKEGEQIVAGCDDPYKENCSFLEADGLPCNCVRAVRQGILHGIAQIKASKTLKSEALTTRPVCKSNF